MTAKYFNDSLVIIFTQWSLHKRKKASPPEYSSGQVPFINIHDLDALTEELANLLGISVSWASES